MTVERNSGIQSLPSISEEVKMTDYSHPMEQFDGKVPEYLLHLQKETGIKNIFDAGFGDCKWVEWTNKHGIEIEGMEVDPDLVERGRLKYPKQASLLHHGDVTEPMPFEDNSFDYVLSIEVIEHIRTPELVIKKLKECYRICKKGVIITTPNCGDEQLLKQYGLIYNHYTHVATEGMKFTKDTAHRHWIKFTKQSLTDLLVNEFDDFVVFEKRPIKVLKPMVYDKLWAQITKEGV